MFKGGPIGVLGVEEMGRDALGVECCMRGIDWDMRGMRCDVVWMRPAAGLKDRIVVAIVNVARAVEYGIFSFLFCILKSAVEVRNGGDVVAFESKRRSRSWIQKSRVESSRW